MPDLGIFSGYLVFRQQGVPQTVLRVPYMGMKGAYDKIKLLAGSAIGYSNADPARQPNANGNFVQLQDWQGGSFDLQTIYPSVGINLRHGAASAVISIFDENVKFLYTAFAQTYLSGGNRTYLFTIDSRAYHNKGGRTIPCSLPNGIYGALGILVKPLGSINNVADREIFLQDFFVVNRSHPTKPYNLSLCPFVPKQPNVKPMKRTSELPFISSCLCLGASVGADVQSHSLRGSSCITLAAQQIGLCVTHASARSCCHLTCDECRTCAAVKKKTKESGHRKKTIKHKKSIVQKKKTKGKVKKTAAEKTLKRHKKPLDTIEKAGKSKRRTQHKESV